MLKIGFIQATGHDYRSYGHPLSFGYITSVLRRDWDQPFEVRVASRPEELLDWSPQVIGIGSVTSCFNQAEEFVELFRRRLPETRIVLGGHHISALPHHLPEGADVGVIGEGERTFLELMRSLRPDNRWAAEDLAGTAGICYRRAAGEVSLTAPRELFGDLDSLPFPTRAVNPSAPHEAIIFTSRGCPFRCSYCTTRGHWKRYRRFSASYVVAELRHIGQCFPGITSVSILDDLYVADRVRLREMVRLIEEAGLNRRLRFHGFVRSSLVDDELCELLRAMNVDAIRFGAESGSDAVLQRMERGGKCSVATHQRAIDLAYRWNLGCTASFMLGYPGETEADLQATIDFIRRNEGRLSVGGLYLTVPLPGTELWRWAAGRGLVSENMDWSRLNLAFANPDFDWGGFLYLNDEALPRERFVTMVRASGLLPAEADPDRRAAQTAHALDRLRSVLASLSERGARRIALYGAGEHTRRIAGHLSGLYPKIVAILDDAKASASSRIGDLDVRHPDDVPSLALDAVVISSDQWEEDIWSRRALIERYGIPVERLYGRTS